MKADETFKLIHGQRIKGLRITEDGEIITQIVLVDNTVLTGAMAVDPEKYKP